MSVHSKSLFYEISCIIKPETYKEIRLLTINSIIVVDVPVPGGRGGVAPVPLRPPVPPLQAVLPSGAVIRQ